MQRGDDSRGTGLPCVREVTVSLGPNHLQVCSTSPSPTSNERYHH
jgi:hypothetical protein